MHSRRIGPSAAIVAAPAPIGAARREYEGNEALGGRDLSQVNPYWVLSLTSDYQRNSRSDGR
jgi:hypothetical protein